MIAGLEMRYGRSDAFNDAGAFVAEDRGERRRHELLPDMRIGCTDARSNHADEHFVGARRLKLHFTEDEGAVFFFQYGCGGGLGHLFLHGLIVDAGASDPAHGPGAIHVRKA